MAVQTVDFANIDTVIKDGVSLSEIVLDGSLIWTAPPVTSEGVNKQFFNTYSAPVVGEASAISGDGLVFALADDSATVNVYSRPSTNSSNFTLLDTINPNMQLNDIQLSHDGSVMMVRGSQLIIAVDDGAGSYTVNYNYPSSKSAALGKDGDTFVVADNDRPHVYFNVGTKAAPNWFLAYEIPRAVRQVSISRRDANGVVVVVSTDGTQYGYLYRYVMDQNLNWTELDRYQTRQHKNTSNAISDDGNEIICISYRAGFLSNGAPARTYSAEILTNNVATNTLNRVVLKNKSVADTAQNYGKTFMSGDGSTAGLRSGLVRNEIFYSKNTPFDSFMSVPLGAYGGDISYDGSTCCVEKNVYELPPIFSISSTPELGLVNEGLSFTIHLDSFNVASGTLVDYTITGIQAADLVEPLTGSFNISNNSADLVFNVVEDLSTEGTQTATLTLDDDPSISIDITILDSSQTP